MSIPHGKQPCTRRGLAASQRTFHAARDGRRTAGLCLGPGVKRLQVFHIDANSKAGSYRPHLRASALRQRQSAARTSFSPDPEQRISVRRGSQSEVHFIDPSDRKTLDIFFIREAVHGAR